MLQDEVTLFFTFTNKTFYRRRNVFLVIWHDSPHQWAMTSSVTSFLDHTQRRTAIGRTPLDEWSAHRRDISLTTHTTHNRQTLMPPMGFEPTISAGERLQTCALDRDVIGTDRNVFNKVKYAIKMCKQFMYLIQRGWICRQSQKKLNGRKVRNNNNNNNNYYYYYIIILNIGLYKIAS